jgi:uncharacterized protein (DUF4415 family)
MKKPKPLTDEEGEVRELLLEDLKRFRPAAEVLSPTVAGKLGVKVRQKGDRVSKERVSLALSRDLLDKFRATGEGWQTRLDNALREWLESHSLS